MSKKNVKYIVHQMCIFPIGGVASEWVFHILSLKFLKVKLFSFSFSTQQVDMPRFRRVLQVRQRQLSAGVARFVEKV